MDVEIKLGVLVNSEAALAKLATWKSFPANIKYRISKTLSQVGPEILQYNQTQGDLVKKYGTPDEENANRYKFPDPENGQAYLDELNKLRDELVRIKPYFLPVDAFDQCPEITAEDMVLLDWLIEGDVEPAATP